jgi:RNA polymerase sigma-70 factor (ECF subfamily)
MIEIRALLLALPNERVVVEHPAGGAFRRHYEQVYRFLRRRTGDDALAEELAQSVFADAAAQLRHLEHEGPPVLAWLYTVARRRLADHVRRASRADLGPLEDVAAADAAANYGTDVARALTYAIGELPEGQQRVVVMKLLEGRSFREIAARVGATEAACKMRFSRGLEALRAELERQGVEP